MALSPDGTSLAADVGAQLFMGDQLYVFNLATGTKRAWSFKTCKACFSSSGGLGFGGVNADALSWTADGKHIAFVGPGASLRAPSAVRLLNTDDPGTNLLADSKPVAGWPSEASPGIGSTWRGAIVTPDGRTVVAVLELATDGPDMKLGEQLVKFSAATGKVTAILNDLNLINNTQFQGYEQVLYTNTTGSVLVVGYLRPGTSAGILHGDTYTPIPWDPHTAIAAW